MGKKKESDGKGKKEKYERGEKKGKYLKVSRVE